jgi:hypothetical protein
MLQGLRSDSADNPPLEDLYGRIGIAAVAAAARYGRRDETHVARDAERAEGQPGLTPGAA